MRETPEYKPRPIILGQSETSTVANSKRKYLVFWAVMPPTVFAASFAGLCAYECSVLPWFTFFIAPITAAIVGIVVAVGYWRRTAHLRDNAKHEVRRFIRLSILWGPAIGVASFVLLLMTVQVAVLLYATLFAAR